MAQLKSMHWCVLAHQMLTFKWENSDLMSTTAILKCIKTGANKSQINKRKKGKNVLGCENWSNLRTTNKNILKLPSDVSRTDILEWGAFVERNQGTSPITIFRKQRKGILQLVPGINE